MGQYLFTVYIHPAPKYSPYPRGSLFYGREVANRVQVWPPTLMKPVEDFHKVSSSGHRVSGRALIMTLGALDVIVQVRWGEFGMVEALRSLLRAALADPSNQRFQLLCEHTLPLQSPLLIYQQLMKEPRSRVNACVKEDWQWQESVSSLILT